MRISLEKFLLLSIIFLSALLRLINLGTTPIGFNDDEAAFGYNAHSILKTGTDEWGRFLPFPAFESFGDWKLVGYLYPVVVSQIVFGENEFATRFPSAVFGIAAVFTTYLLTKKLFENAGNPAANQKHDGANLKITTNFKGRSGIGGGLSEAKISNRERTKTSRAFFDGGGVAKTPAQIIALLAAFFLAISPWHIIASRNAFESDILIFFLTLATYLFLRGLVQKKYLTLSLVAFALSFYVYRSSWLFVPIFVTVLIFLYRKTLFKSKLFLAKNILLFLIIILPLAPTVLTFRGQSRFFQESFITGVQRSGIIDELNQKRGVCQQFQPPLVCTLILNKYSAFTFRYFANYVSNLSPQAYYINPTPSGYQGFSSRSPFYLFELPLLLIGLFFILKTKESQAKILIAWILIVPLGASITGTNNLGRLNIIIPAPQIISAFGLICLFNLLKSNIFKKAALALASFFIFISLSGMLIDLFYYLPYVSARNQRYGYKQLFTYLVSQKASYGTIAISRKSDDAKQYIHYLFFAKINPQEFLDPQNTIRYRGQDGWQVVEKIGNFYFYPSTPSIENLPSKTLLAVGEKEVSFPANPVFVTSDPKRDRIFEVYDLEQVKKTVPTVNKIK